MYLSYRIMQSFSHRTEVKTLFLVLWFNCESRIEIDREKWIKNFFPPMDSRITLLKNLVTTITISQGREGKRIKALEVYIA